MLLLRCGDFIGSGVFNCFLSSTNDLPSVFAVAANPFINSLSNSLWLLCCYGTAFTKCVSIGSTFLKLFVVIFLTVDLLLDFSLIFEREGDPVPMNFSLRYSYNYSRYHML